MLQYFLSNKTTSQRETFQSYENIYFFSLWLLSLSHSVSCCRLASAASGTSWAGAYIQTRKALLFFSSPPQKTNHFGKWAGGTVLITPRRAAPALSDSFPREGSNIRGKISRGNWSSHTVSQGGRSLPPSDEGCTHITFFRRLLVLAFQYALILILSSPKYILHYVLVLWYWGIQE